MQIVNPETPVSPTLLAKPAGGSLLSGAFCAVRVLGLQSGGSSGAKTVPEAWIEVCGVLRVVM